MTRGSAPGLEIRSLGIVGAGLMGTGIAEVAAAAGFPTVLVKVTGGDPAAALGRVARSLGRRVDKGSLAAVPYLIGAVAAYEQGLAGAVETDTAMKLGCNHPIGPVPNRALLALILGEPDEVRGDVGHAA